MVTTSVLPAWPVYQSVDGMDYALRRVLSQVDISKLRYWWDPQRCAEEVLGPMLRFLELQDLDTEIFGTAYRRNLYASAPVLRKYRGSDYVLEVFDGLLGVSTSYDLTPEAGIPTGIRFRVHPPLGTIPDADWQAFFRRAYRWLLPPYLGLDFAVGFLFDAVAYHRAAFKITKRIK